MTLRARIDLATLAIRNVPMLTRLIRDGELDIRHAWMAVKGSGEYARAIASGDIAGDQEVARRLRACMECPLHTTEFHGGGIATHWCGSRLVDDTDDGGGCGCLIEGKIEVASQACPHGRWAAVTIGATT